MRSFLLAAIAIMASTPAFAAVAVTIGQPGFYGHIEIGESPPPQVIYAQPVIIQRAPPGVVVQPVYLRVPPGQQKNWKKHCRHYNACGQPVYFVQDKWYNDVYVPDYRHRHGGDRHDDHRDNHRDDHRDDHGNGRDKH